MKYILSLLFILIVGTSFAQKKRLPSFKEVQAYNQTNLAILRLATTNATHRVTGDSITLSVSEINEVLQLLDDKLNERDHKRVTDFIQSAINRKKKK